MRVRSFWWVGGGFRGSAAEKPEYLENGTLPVNPNRTVRKSRVLWSHWWVYYIENYPSVITPLDDIKSNVVSPVAIENVANIQL